MLGKDAGVSRQEMASAQAGQSSNPKTQAALYFSAKLVNNRTNIAFDVDLDFPEVNLHQAA
jgi:hypothetical protein